MSFEKVRNALVYSLVDEIIDEEEFVLLFDAYKSVNPSYPYWEYDCFCLDSFDASECLTEFRVSKEIFPVWPRFLEFLHSSDAPKELFVVA